MMLNVLDITFPKTLPKGWRWMIPGVGVYHDRNRVCAMINDSMITASRAKGPPPTEAEMLQLVRELLRLPVPVQLVDYGVEETGRMACAYVGPVMTSVGN